MTTKKWFVPVPIPYLVTWTFDQHPYYGRGTDFGGDNMPIRASRGGRVSQVTNSYEYPSNPGTGYANRVVLDHGPSEDNKALVSYYAHLRPNIPVKVNDLVNTGDIIGYSNNTGNSSGPHLHFETREGNVPFNHYPYLVQTIEEVDGETPPEPLPEFPALPQCKILATPYLNIRQKAGAQYRDVGDIYPGKIVNVMSATQIGEDLWLQIGYDQYIAMLYKGNKYAEWIV